MLIPHKKYRSDYTGEKIVTERTHLHGVWHDVYEFIPNAVTNNQISNCAAVIGNGPTRLTFDLNNLKNYSGLLGATTLQTYGCNALYRDFTPDFLVAIGNNGIIDEIADSRYHRSNIVYSNAIHMLEHPNKFYLIPYDPYADAGTTAIYIAAFDGHKKIFLLGFEGQDTPGVNVNVYANTNGYDRTKVAVSDIDQVWIKNRKLIFDTYHDVEFIRVGGGIIPESWKYCPNFRQISYRDFVLEANL
jgi:hypothetical protein